MELKAPTVLTVPTATTGWSGFRLTPLEAVGQRGEPCLEVAARPDGAER